MRKIAVTFFALLLSGCSVESGSFDFEFPRINFAADESAPPEAPITRAQFCRFGREALGMPILVNSELRKEAYATLGREKATNLFRPLARANNSFRCLCGTPDERLNAKCGGEGSLK